MIAEILKKSSDIMSAQLGKENRNAKNQERNANEHL